MTSQPNHALVRGNRGNQQACGLLVHRPVIIKTIDLVRGEAAVDFYLIFSVDNPRWLLVEENNVVLGQVMSHLTDI